MVIYEVGEGDFYLLHSVQIASEAHQLPTKFWTQIGRNVMRTIHFYPVPKLRMVELKLNSPSEVISWRVIN
jgi:hypothetical protein